MGPGAWTPSVGLSLGACAGILALGLVVLLRGARNPLAPPLALLCIDMFVWNFCTLAQQVSGAEAWGWLDVTFSPFTPPLALHVILVFTGQRRALRWVLLLAYLAFSGLALSAAAAFFSPAARAWVRSDSRGILFLGLWLPLVVLELGLLIRHWRRSTSIEEQWRARLIIAAVVVGAALGSTEMWDQFIAIPALGHLGALSSMAIIAAVVLRFRFFGSELSASVAIYALALAAVGTFGYLAVFRWFAPNTALWAIVTASLTLALFAAARDAIASLIARRARLQQLASLGRITAQMAHDLKNPLAALKGALQFLQEERAQGRSLAPHHDFLDLMLQQVARIEGVIDKYQRLSRVEPRLGPVALNEVVESVLTRALLAQETERQGIQLERELAPALPVLQADRDLLAGALENVVRNAIEAMPGGGTLQVSTSCAERDNSQGAVTIRVADAGQGMDARLLERAFDDFFTTKPQGTGLGLSFVRRVLVVHGGDVRLTSRLGRGTTVELVLPLTALDRSGG